MAGLLPVPSVVGVTCRQSPADCHLYSNVLAFCYNFNARKHSICGACDVFATYGCSPSGLVLSGRVSLPAGLARGATGSEGAPAVRFSNTVERDGNKVKQPIYSDALETAALEEAGNHVFHTAKVVERGPAFGCNTHRVSKLDEITTPLTLLISSVSSSPGFERLLVSNPREFWIVHVLLSGLVPTLVGWQLLQYSCGMLDGWLQPTKFRSLGVRGCRAPVTGGKNWGRDESRVNEAEVSLLKRFHGELLLSSDTVKKRQEFVPLPLNELELPPFLLLLQSLNYEVLAISERLAVPFDSQCRSTWPNFHAGNPSFMLRCLDMKGWLRDVSEVSSLLRKRSRSPAEVDCEKFEIPVIRNWTSHFNVAICRVESWLRYMRGRNPFRWNQSQLSALRASPKCNDTEHMSDLVLRSPPSAVAPASDPKLGCSYLWDMGLSSWLKRMSMAYGTSFVGLIVMGYWIQGFRSFPWLAVSFLFKDGLQVDPATMQFIFSSASLPMVAKPIYGILSDALFIGGCHRLPYLAIAASLQALSWGAIVMNPGATASLGVLTMLLAVSNLGAAIAEVMNDALVAEAGKKDTSSTGELQSLAWVALATGGVLGSLCGGLALKRIDCHTMFAVFLLMVSAQLIVCFTVSERSFGLGSTSRDEGAVVPPITETGYRLSLFKVKAAGDSPTVQANKEHRIAQIDENQAFSRLVGVVGDVAKVGVGMMDPSGTVSLPGSGAANLGGETFVEKSKGQGGDYVDRKDWNGQANVAKASFPDRSSSLEMMRQQFTMLMELIRKPDVVKPLLWFVASYAMIPTLGSSLFFFQTQELHIDPAFLGIQKVVGQLGLMAGSVLFNRHLKHLPLRKVVACVQGLLCFCMLSDFLLVSRVNLLLGIKDELFVLGVSAFVEAVAQFKILPFMVLLAQLCPAGSEGSLLAFFMSAHCLANTFSAYLGVALATLLQISSNNFTYLPLGIFVQAMAALVPVMLIGLIPEDPRAASRTTKVDKKVL